MTQPLDDALLSVAQVLKLFEDVARDEEEARRAQDRLEESQRKLGAVELLIGRRRLEEITASARRSRASNLAHNVPSNAAAAQGVEMAWTDWIVEQLTTMGGRASTQQLIDAARADPRMSERFNRTPNGYYNGLSRVTARGRAKKVGKIVALPGVEVDTQQGEAPSKGGPLLFN